ncbi:MAG: DUF177 domain-containing protein [Bacteroidales bacterium]|nr:DUF177 domain-containing protein [Bacteroidales bacterium]MBN2633275.1 DUF177 domain-containing protein [Bacteroidales bacterium]
MSGAYNIPISGLKDGRHRFEFEVEDDFFEQFEESEIKEGNLAVTVEAEKTSSHIDMIITIGGTVNISCDRCLGIFSQPLNCENRLLVRSGKVYDDSDPDIITVPDDDSTLDMSQYLYEYILLALPVKRTHPDDGEGNSTCDPDMLRKLSEHSVKQEEKHDHRWDDLKTLLMNNN